MQKIRRSYEGNRLFDCHVRGTICSLNEKRPWLNGITLKGTQGTLRDLPFVSQVLHDGEPKPHFLWKAEALQRSSEPGSYLSIACTLSEHLNARPSVSP